MKIYLLLIGLSMSILLNAQVLKTVANTAGNLETLLTAEELNTVTHLTITGTIDANDIATINNVMPALTELDISQTTISGCTVPSVDTFEPNWFPGPSLSKNSLNYGGLTKPLLTSVLLPSSLEVLGSSALEYSGITSVDIPPTVTSIGWSAFARSALTSITVPSSVTYMGEYVFDGCNSLNDVILESALTTIPRGTFSGCSSLSSVNIPPTVTTIQMTAFSYCSNLSSITLPQTVNSIESNAFYGCSGLTSLYSKNPVPPQTQTSFDQVDKANCILYVPSGSGELYASAAEWQEFANIVEEPGLWISSNTVTLGPENNSLATIRLHSKSTWTITSNQTWLTISPAAGSNNETITFNAQANPLFEARIATVNVSTNDGYFESVTVTQSARSNTAPVAQAGNDQTVVEGETVQLDGSSSSDAENDALTYQWSAPDGIVLSGSNTSGPTFTAPLIDNQVDLTFILIVNDGIVNSAEDRIVVTIQNKVELSVSDNSVALNAANNSSATIDIYCNSTWNASSNQSWLTVNPLSESGNHVLTFTAQANPEYSSRSATVTITAGNDLTETITVTQEARANTAPVANAGPDQTVDEGETVQLDGSASLDPDGNTITYRWTAPEGITLSSTTAARTTFTAPQVNNNTQYTFVLVVNDGQTTSPENHVIITVLNAIELSVSDHTVSMGASENLTETIEVVCNSSWQAVSDHSWLTVSPASSQGNQQLTLTAQPNTLFTSRSAEVIVSTSNDLTETISITQSGRANSVPVANAGPDQTVDEGETVQLDGSASSDADGNTITYRWTAPEGITLSSTTAARPTFTAPQVNNNTQYTFALVVNDGNASSAENQVIITVLNEIELSVSDHTVSMGAAENLTETIEVVCNSSWQAVSDQSWLSVSPATSQGNQQLILTAQPNTLFTSRSAEVIVSTSNDLTETISIIQSGRANSAPVAIAGPDQTVDEGENVQLDGSASSDADGNTITYRWTAPEGITLSSTTAARPTFTAPQVNSDTDFILTLVVNDGQTDSPDDRITITVINLSELSVSEKNVTLGAANNSSASVTLRCNTSWNASCNHDWLTISPETSNGDQIITFTAQANPSNSARSADVIIATTTGLSETIIITQQGLTNTAPVANAGIDQMVRPGDIVQLNGTASSDIDNDALTYLWTAPVGITLSSLTQASPTFTAPQTEVETTYTFTLVVNDGQVNSTADQITITVTNNAFELNLSASSVVFERRQSTARIILSGNAPWTAISDQAWLTVTPASGTGDQMLVITALANDTYLVRTGAITFSAPGAITQTFEVTQEGLPVGTDVTEARPTIKYYPNPFSQEIAIEIANPMHEAVSVEIYTMTGQRIKNLAKERKDELISVHWNGTNDFGQLVPYGMYVLKINDIAKQIVFGH